jgi:riboflavin synthase
MTGVADCACCAKPDAWLANAHAFVRFDRYPVTPGILALVGEAKRLLDERFAPQGCNTGVNVGEVAGRTVMQAC